MKFGFRLHETTKLGTQRIKANDVTHGCLYSYSSITIMDVEKEAVTKTTKFVLNNLNLRPDYDK